MTKLIKKRLKILLTLVVLLLPISIWATGAALALELKNGKKEYYKLQEKPVLTVSDSKLMIKTMTIDASHERSDIERFYFVDEPVGIEEVEEAGNTVTFTQKEEGVLEISNLPEKEHVVVSNLSGRLYSDCVSTNGTVTIVDLSSCPKGIYVIKIGKQQTIKMVKK